MTNNRKLIESGMLLAVSVILTRYFSIRLAFYGVDGVRIGLGILPIIIAGLRYDAWQGAKVGALADIVGYILSPGGPYMPHFTITSALYGILPPLLVGRKEKLNSVRIILTVSLTHGILSLAVIPYFLFQLFGIPYQAIFLPRLISFVMNVVLINFLLIILDKRTSIIRVIPHLQSKL